MRPVFALNSNESPRFQSTHPIKDETIDKIRWVITCEFQSTHPIKDETIHILVLRFPICKFQSTHPIKDETKLLKNDGLYGKISIHSPYKGWDVKDNIRI